MSNVIDIYVGESSNPKTGEVVQRPRAELADGSVITILNSVEELQAKGSKEAAMRGLRVFEKTFEDGTTSRYALLHSVKKVADIF